MFKIIYGDDLFDFPHLANDMFQDRRTQFCEAFGWDLNVDELGREIDQYDLMNPLYVILQDGEGRHLGSGRLMPTTGPTMIADHFADMTDDVEIESPLIWEVTRVFIARRGKESIRNAAALMWAGCQLGLKSGVQFYVGVTAYQMARVFTACGWKSDIIGERKTGRDGHIAACLWEISQENCDRLAAKAGITPGEFNLSVYRKPITKDFSSDAVRNTLQPIESAGFEMKMM